jgi:prefoldin subunit 5
VKAELQRMRSLFAMLSAQVQEIGRSVQAIRNTINENR